MGKYQAIHTIIGHTDAPTPYAASKPHFDNYYISIAVISPNSESLMGICILANIV